MKYNILRAERELRGWSQAKIAESLGISAKTVGRWERGEATPYPHYREQLCTLFGKQPEQLGWPLNESILKSQVSDEEQQRQANTIQSASLFSPAIADPSLLIDPAIPQMLNSLPGREQVLRQIKQRLFATDNLALTALNGLSGVGKTALAVAVATDRQIQAYFDDGILWARLGPHPNVLGQLIRWGTLLGVVPSQIENVKSPQAWSQALRDIINTHRLLLIIEDAWTIEDAVALQIGGPGCTHLLTTHLPQVAQAFAEQHTITISPLADKDAIALLESFVPQISQQDPKRLQTLVRALNCLPLALTLMGKHLALQAQMDQPLSLQTILTQLHKIEQRLCVNRGNLPEEFSHRLGETVPLSLHATIALCDAALSSQAHSALCTLSLFASKSDSFSKEAVLAIGQASIETLDELLKSGLLECVGPERYSVHQAIADSTRIQPKSTFHQALRQPSVEESKQNQPPPSPRHIARDDTSHVPVPQPVHSFPFFPSLMLSTILLCILLIASFSMVSRLFIVSHSVSPSNAWQSTTVTIDDSIQGIGTNEFNYLGAGWQHGAERCKESSCLYNYTNSWDKTVNDSMVISFTGIQMKFYGVMDPRHGIGAVSVDGSGETMIDFYAPTRMGDQLLWTSPLLPPGTHVFKLRVTGNKNLKSLDSFVTVDRVDILS